MTLRALVRRHPCGAGGGVRLPSFPAGQGTRTLVTTAGFGVPLMTIYAQFTRWDRRSFAIHTTVHVLVTAVGGGLDAACPGRRHTS